MSKELDFIKLARKAIGTKEIRGSKHNSKIVGWLKHLGAWWFEDETPWCGVFVAECLKSTGRPIPKHWYRAKGYLDYGTGLSKPAYGSIAVLSRRGGGHVAFVVGEDTKGNILLLGGNQGNEVSIRAYNPNRIIDYRWAVKPNGALSKPFMARYKLPVISADKSTTDA